MVTKFDILHPNFFEELIVMDEWNLDENSLTEW